MKTLSSRFQPKRNLPPPPESLGAAGRLLWVALTSEFNIDDSGVLTSLLTVCRSEEDIVRMREIVARDGDTYLDRFEKLAAHPLLNAIRGAEQVKRQALKSLNLDIEPLRDKK
jgi:hypothetical protein